MTYTTLHSVARSDAYRIRKHCKATDIWCGCCKWAVWTTNGVTDHGRVTYGMDAVLVASYADALKTINKE